MEIEWRKVKTNSNYEVSNLGDVKSLYNNKILTPQGRRPTIKLYTTPKTCEERFVDQMVCEAFYPLLYNGQTIKHIDGDVKNCAKWNLRFKKQSIDNINYYVYYELEQRGKIRVLNAKTDEIFTMSSAEMFQNTDRIFYVLDPFRQFEDDTYIFNDTSLKEFPKCFIYGVKN